MIDIYCRRIGPSTAFPGSSVAIGSRKTGIYVSLRGGECAPDARRRSQHMFPPVGHARRRWRVLLTGRVRGTDRIIVCSRFVALIMRTRNACRSSFARRVRRRRERIVQHRDVAQYLKGGMGNMSRARASILYDDKSWQCDKLETLLQFRNLTRSVAHSNII